MIKRPASKPMIDALVSIYWNRSFHSTYQTLRALSRHGYANFRRVDGYRERCLTPEGAALVKGALLFEDDWSDMRAIAACTFHRY